MSAEPLFGPEVVDAVVRHMNDDHAADCLVIVRAMGGPRHATAARMSGLDAQGATFDADVDGATVAVRIPWSTGVTDRASIRAEVVRMYHDAREILDADLAPGER